MLSWRLSAPKKLELEELPSKPIPSGFVKVKVEYSAISRLDLLAYEGKVTTPKLPITLGRQAVGMITEAAEDVTNFERGNRVVLDPFMCCDDCSGAKKNSCVVSRAYGIDEDGFLSDFVVVRKQEVFLLPDHIKSTDAIFVPHIALANNIVSKLQLKKGEHIVILGSNIVGLILAQVAIHHQAVPIILDHRPERLSLAESLGAYYCINPKEEDAVKKIFAITGGNMSETLCYSTQSAHEPSKTFDYLAYGGRIAVIGWAGTETNIQTTIVPILQKQLSIIGISNGAKLIPSALNMIALSGVKTAPLISKEIPFSEVGSCIETSINTSQEHLKILVKM
ncbi:MAG: alcohol dehydrogenase catalytic domain-containing protein [Firmicutes bacterium]|nr:alcohol dehydrogenase catalytic domain-containing protein [Bacillota bacterium]